MGGPSSAISEVNIFNELCIIKNQIEKLIAIQSAEKMNCPNRNFIYVKPQVCTAPKNQIGSFSASVPKRSSQNLHIDAKLLPTSVHINPNFIPQKPTVHINPSVHAKDVHMIHVNPKIMNHIVNSNQNIPINRANLSATETNIDKTINSSNIKTSIHVNPTLLKHLKETMTSSKEPVTKEQSLCLRSKPFKNISNQISPKRTSNTGIVHLSRRKLVRVASTTKSKTPISQGNKSINRSKVTKYKIDRTVLQVKKLKRNCLERRKVRDDMTKLVTIGDIVYKASKNKLVRNSSSLKRRKSISGKGSKLNIATSDKKQRTLRRSFNVLNRTLDTNTNSKTRYSFNISPKTTYKNSISNKAKQKSIRILRNKMHKNNQPCLIFQRFGSCPNHNKGTCPKRHDKKQVSLCKKFLQGKCLLDKCPLSHHVGPEKMPTCKYFLDGRCTRDNCPYVHVKVSSTTLICIDFLRGYCAKGNKCQRRHEYLCPEFDRAGKCKLEKCPYPHKSHSSHSEKNAKYSSKTRDVRDHQAARNDSEIPNPESRLRYYEVTNDVSRDFEKKKDTVQRIDFDSSVKETDIKSLPRQDGHASETKSNAKDQVCIGGYIPIDPSN